MTRAETAGLVAALTADPDLVVHVMHAPDEAPTPYVLVRPARTTDTQERLSGSYATRTPSWTVMAVGGDHLECEWTVEHIDAALRPNGFGVQPSVPGRRCDSIRRDALYEIDYDDDTSPPLIYQVAEYSFRSSPIPNPA